ncbi:MAG: ABC transporter permease [Bacillota bacterium]
MLLFKMALRNLSRHKKRVIAIAVILAVGISLYLTIDSLMLGLTEMSFNNLINLETGDLQLVNHKYWAEKEDLPLENLIAWDSNLKQRIKQIDAIKSVAPQLKFAAKLNNGVDELPVTGYGIDYQQAQKVFKTDNYILEGSYFSNDGYQAVLGKKLANLMDLKTGDYLTLLVKTSEKTFNTIDAEIVGLVNTQNPDVNRNYVYIPLNIAQQALNVEGKASQIVIKLNENRDVNAVVKQLNRSSIINMRELKAHSWRDLAKSVIAMNRAQNIETLVMMSIVLMIAALGIVNTIILAALERVKEIGMMKALGFRNKEIILMFMIEAAGIGFIGGLIALVLSGGGVYYLVHYGIDLSALLGEQTFGLPIIGQLYGKWAPFHFILIFGAGVILSVIASIPPAYWAAQQDPVEAIQG